MGRAIILVLDSFGVGATADAERFGDVGSDTFGHIASVRAQSDAGPLQLPNLARLGLYHASRDSTGEFPTGVDCDVDIVGAYGFAEELSSGKDTPSGHWEIAGVPVMFDWGYFPETIPCFPKELTDALIAEAQLPGIIGNKHASGTAIIAELGMEHIRSGRPICYTSADSVFQIAAHEIHFGLERLYAVSTIARRLVDPLKIGRVIARPFVGEDAAGRDRRVRVGRQGVVERIRRVVDAAHRDEHPRRVGRALVVRDRVDDGIDRGRADGKRVESRNTPAPAPRPRRWSPWNR